LEVLTLEYLKSILRYDHETGNWHYLVSRGRNGAKGSIAGYCSKDGYHRILFKRKNYLSHRLAWFYMTGEWPKEFIDHINRNKIDNRWCNLREATASQNNRNKSVNRKNTTGLKGVSAGKDGKFRVYICLGTFSSKEEAKNVYDEAAKKIYGEFYRA
jgi:hypothetical protein